MSQCIHTPRNLPKTTVVSQPQPTGAIPFFTTHNNNNNNANITSEALILVLPQGLCDFLEHRPRNRFEIDAWFRDGLNWYKQMSFWLQGNNMNIADPQLRYLACVELRKCQEICKHRSRKLKEKRGEWFAWIDYLHQQYYPLVEKVELNHLQLSRLRDADFDYLEDGIEDKIGRELCCPGFWNTHPELVHQPLPPVIDMDSDIDLNKWFNKPDP